MTEGGEVPERKGALARLLSPGDVYVKRGGRWRKVDAARAAQDRNNGAATPSPFLTRLMNRLGPDKGEAK